MATNQRASAFGELLRRYRARAGLTQEALAQRAGLSARGIADLERGARRAPYPNTVGLLIEALQLAEAEAAALRGAAGRAAVRTELTASVPGLPTLSTSFVGREHELVAAAQLLNSARLLTLTGLGGIGKTRLAVELAQRVAAAYADGVSLVDLASLADERLVPQSVGVALGVRDQPGRPLLETLVRVLHTRQTLLILDNCEHLIAACAELAAALLRDCPELRILATSRVMLGVAGEATRSVPALSLPDSADASSPERLARSEAVRLFVERARAARPDFALSADVAAGVADVCARLEGLPLALELAAPWLRVLSVQQLASRLRDRFALLVDGTADAPGRRRTLQATLDWSFDLLGEPEQRLLEHLSVFAGGATLDAIAAVHDDKPVSSVRLLELVRHLLEASLLKPAGGVAGHPRWTMLETVREYASERLRRRPEAAQVHARHAAYFAALLQRPDHNLWSFRPSPALARVEPELDNVRTALAWAHDHRQVDMGLRLVWSLVPLVDRRGHPRELLEWGEDFLALDDPHARGPSKKRARALCATAYCAMFTGQLDRGIALAQAAETEFRAIRPIDDAPAAESLDTAAMPVYLRAYVAWFSGQPEAADALAGEAVALARRTGARRVVAWALLVRGIVSGHQGRFAAAQAYLDEARALASAPADESILTRIDIALGALLCRQQASGRAISLYREAQEIGGEPEDNMVAQLVLDGLARVAYLEGQPEDAARLLGAADARYEALGVQWPRHPYEPPPSHERFVAQVRAVLGDLRFTELAATGRGLSVGAALALVHAEPV